jgi:hypothetical protein
VRRRTADPGHARALTQTGCAETSRGRFAAIRLPRSLSSAIRRGDGFVRDVPVPQMYGFGFGLAIPLGLP